MKNKQDNMKEKSINEKKWSRKNKYEREWARTRKSKNERINEKDVNKQPKMKKNCWKIYNYERKQRESLLIRFYYTLLN